MDTIKYIGLKDTVRDANFERKDNVMKKIPTLFIREFENNRIINIKNEVVPGMEWVLKGEGVATRKLDGTCCLVQDNKIYARFDLKPGRKLPENAIPCQEKPDKITGHFPHWVLVTDQPQYKYHRRAFNNQKPLEDGTYELCGEHFNKNKENIVGDKLFRHGEIILDVPRSFEGIRDYLEKHVIEGIVFWKDGEPKCKIKRSDFGFNW